MSTPLSTLVQDNYPEIFVTSRTDPATQHLVKNINPNLLRILDGSLIEFSSMARYLLCMAQIMGTKHVTPLNMLRNLSGEVLSTAHFSILVIGPREDISDFRSCTRIQTYHIDCPVSGCTAVLGTGSLNKWLESIFANTTKQADSSFGHRYIYNLFQIHLQRAEGLALLFDNYRKVRLIDRTFVLEHK